MILTVLRTHAPVLPQSACWPVAHLDFLRGPIWRERGDVEHDERFLQPIAYLIRENDHGQAWCYRRTGGDARLDGRCSGGVGGHMDDGDPICQDPFYAADTLPPSSANLV